MKKYLFYVYIFIIVLLCNGCFRSCGEDSADFRIYALIINNNTIDTIYFDFDRKRPRSYPDGKVYTTTCLPKTKTLYDISFTLSYAETHCPDFLNSTFFLVPPLQVRTSSGRELTKSFILYYNWYCEQTTDTLKVIFEINEEDLE